MPTPTFDETPTQLTFFVGFETQWSTLARENVNSFSGSIGYSGFALIGIVPVNGIATVGIVGTPTFVGTGTLSITVGNPDGFSTIMIPFTVVNPISYPFKFPTGTGMVDGDIKFALDPVKATLPGYPFAPTNFAEKVDVSEIGERTVGYINSTSDDTEGNDNLFFPASLNLTLELLDTSADAKALFYQYVRDAVSKVRMTKGTATLFRGEIDKQSVSSSENQTVNMTFLNGIAKSKDTPIKNADGDLDEELLFTEIGIERINYSGLDYVRLKSLIEKILRYFGAETISVDLSKSFLSAAVCSRGAGQPPPFPIDVWTTQGGVFYKSFDDFYNDDFPNGDLGCLAPYSMVFGFGDSNGEEIGIQTLIDVLKNLTTIFTADAGVTDEGVGYFRSKSVFDAATEIPDEKIISAEKSALLEAKKAVIVEAPTPIDTNVNPTRIYLTAKGAGAGINRVVKSSLGETRFDVAYSGDLYQTAELFDSKSVLIFKVCAALDSGYSYGFVYTNSPYRFLLIGATGSPNTPPLIVLGFRLQSNFESAIGADGTVTIPSAVANFQWWYRKKARENYRLTLDGTDWLITENYQFAATSETGRCKLRPLKIVYRDLENTSVMDAINIS